MCRFNDKSTHSLIVSLSRAPFSLKGQNDGKPDTFFARTPGSFSMTLNALFLYFALQRACTVRFLLSEKKKEDVADAIVFYAFFKYHSSDLNIIW